MDIFRIKNGLTGEGEILNNISNVMWVERYLDAGEFTISCPATEYFRTKLAPGTFISHTNTDEVMIVETQIIDQTKDGELKLEVSGRSMEAILMENRIVHFFSTGTLSPNGTKLNVYGDTTFSSTFNSGDPNYSGKPTSWLISKFLIEEYCANNGSGDPSYEGVGNLAYDEILSSRTNYNDPITEKTGYTLKNLSSVYTNVKELLASTKSGIKGIRVNYVSGYPVFKFVIHQGFTKVGFTQGDNTVVFSMSAGDLESARYMWRFDPSVRAYVYSNEWAFQYPTEYITAPATYPSNIPTGFYRWAFKTTAYDSGDLTYLYTPGSAVTDAQAAAIRSVLKTNSNIAINEEKKMSIIDAKVNKNCRYKYKEHYNIGDIVWVSGDYDATTIMRVTEHAQVLDENGESSIPTLTPW